SVIDELVARGLRRSRRRCFPRRRTRLMPGLASIIGALDDLPKPAAGLGRIQPIRIHGGSFDVIYLPTCEVRTTDVPLLALAVGCQDKRALACAYQHSYLTHCLSSSRGARRDCL